MRARIGCGSSADNLRGVLVRSQPDGALAIGQLSHSWLSGQIARAWGNARFEPPEPLEEVVLGAQQHDIGWALFDLEPRFNADTGLPRSFLELGVQEHLSIWSDAPDQLVSQSLHAALVVSMHGRSLSELRMAAGNGEVPELRAHAERERVRQEQLCQLLGVTEEQAQRTRRQMWTWDGLSLALCLGWRPFIAKDVPAREEGLLDVELREREDGTIALEPWPLAEERVELRCEARRLAARYEDEAAMRAAFEQAEPVTLEFTLSGA